MTDDERWLRDTLTVDAVPPPDLADRAERTARRIVRRRIAGGALAVAAVVAVPLAVTRDGTDRPTAGPNPTAGPSRAPDPACAGPYGSRLELAPRPARSAADAAWPYRGDGDLRPAAVAAGAGLADVRPLFGERLPGGGTVVLAAGRDTTGWRLRYAVTGTGAGTAEQVLPALGPGTQLGLLLQGSGQVRGAGGVGTVVVVVAPPGTRSIDFVHCRPDGRPRSFLVEDEVFVQDVGPGSDTGTVTMTTAEDATVELGPPATRYAGDFGSDPTDVVPVPGGYREVPGLTAGGGVVDYRGAQVVEGARVLVRCRTPDEYLVVRVGGEPVRVRCDGLVQVVADGATLRPGLRLLSLPTGIGNVDVRAFVPEG